MTVLPNEVEDEFSEFFQPKMPKEFIMAMVLGRCGLDLPPQRWINVLTKHPDGLPLPKRIYWSAEPMATDKPEWNLKPEDHRLYEELHNRIGEGDVTPESCLEPLLALQAKYPQSPMLYTLLMGYYRDVDDIESVDRTLDSLVEKFPDYLFGKVNLAWRYARLKQPEKIQELLNNKFEIYDLDPKKLYHVSEIAAFYGMTCSYFTLVDNLYRALYSYAVVFDAYPEHPSLGPLVADMGKHFGYDAMAAAGDKVHETRKLKSLKRR